MSVRVIFTRLLVALRPLDEVKRFRIPWKEEKPDGTRASLAREQRGTASQLTSVAPCRGEPRARSLDVSHIYARTWLARLVEDKQSSMCRCILIDGAGDEEAARRRRTGG